MFEKWKANILFQKMLGRPDISKAYAMVGPEDSWSATITKVHDSLAEIQQLPHEILELKSHDGLLLKGIYYPSQGSDTTVICAHGYTSHAEREWAFPGLFYHSLGFNVLIPYHRAHGISEGKYITFGALEHRDMMGWVELVNRRTPGGSIVLHGLSMGGGIVLFMADKPMENVKCIIADAPSNSIVGFFQGVSCSVFKKGAEGVCRSALAKFRKEFAAEPADFDIEKTLTGGRYPLLLAAGSMEQCEELFARLTACNPMETETVILPGCNHGNGMYKQTDLFQSTIRNFIFRHLEKKGETLC